LSYRVKKNVIEQGGYTPEQVFNADEIGLFWKRMPSRIFLSKNEKTAPGFSRQLKTVSPYCFVLMLVVS